MNVCKIDKYVHPNIGFFGRIHQFGCADLQGFKQAQIKEKKMVTYVKHVLWIPVS